MRIGLDIDNVITNFDEVILSEFLKEDKNKRNTGVVNPNADWVSRGMFDWSETEIHDFFKDNMEEISKKLQPIEDAKYYMDKLLNDGHKLYLISNRPYRHYKNPNKTTVNWLNENGINYTKLIISAQTDKSKECLEHKIDIMVDDIVENCNQLISNGVKCILMETKYNTNKLNGLIIAHGWSDLYNKLCNVII